MDRQLLADLVAVLDRRMKLHLSVTGRTSLSGYRRAEPLGSGHRAPDRIGAMSRKWTQVGLLAATILLAMSVWFSASAVVPQLTAEWKLSGGQKSWLTMSVQIGFVAGALARAAAQPGGPRAGARACSR